MQGDLMKIFVPKFEPGVCMVSGPLEWRRESVAHALVCTHVQWEVTLQSGEPLGDKFQYLLHP